METKDNKIIRISDLIVRYLLNGLTEEEQQELENWLKESEQHRSLMNDICNLPGLPFWEREQRVLQEKEAFRKFLQKRNNLKKKRIAIRILQMLKYAALWLLPIFTAGGIWWGYRQTTQQSQQMLPLHSLEVCGGHKPVLMLENGEEIVVDKENQELSSFAGISLTGQDAGRLNYTVSVSGGVKREYHTLRTPSQCDYHFILSDGTKIWVNAASSVRYPVAFGAEKREIFISGEVYLEVAKDSLRPFYVITDEVKVRVLGTAFNVHAYVNDDYAAITLVEGKIAAYLQTDTCNLLPAQQLYYDRTDGQVECRFVNVQEYISWKEGQYSFKGQTLEEVAKILERWYDIRVLFENKRLAQEIYTGVVCKEESVESFVERLNASAGYHCHLKENIIYIKY